MLVSSAIKCHHFVVVHDLGKTLPHCKHHSDYLKLSLQPHKATFINGKFWVGVSTERESSGSL